MESEKVEGAKTPQSTNKISSLSNLRDTEQSILNYMLSSHVNFLYIKNKLSKYDFTFLIHMRIFKHLIIQEKMLFSKEADFNILLEIFSEILEKTDNVKSISTLNILSKPPSMHRIFPS